MAVLVVAGGKLGSDAEITGAVGGGGTLGPEGPVAARVRVRVRPVRAWRAAGGPLDSGTGGAGAVGESVTTDPEGPVFAVRRCGVFPIFALSVAVNNIRECCTGTLFTNCVRCCCTHVCHPRPDGACTTIFTRLDCSYIIIRVSFTSSTLSTYSVRCFRTLGCHPIPLMTTLTIFAGPPHPIFTHNRIRVRRAAFSTYSVCH